MLILAIETSCDETAIAVLSAVGKSNPSASSGPRFKIEAHRVASQIALHQQYGGVFPMMAKREHARNIVPLFSATLKKAGLLRQFKSQKSKVEGKIRALLTREQDIIEPFLEFISTYQKPKIDRITVTVGPGLEPALWVGINFAKALSLAWNIPVVPVNHMEGHVLSVFPEENKKEFSIPKTSYPMLSLLVSGGHTELVLVKKFGSYVLVGQTRDDAAGEAFDKVARMLELPYPGGPQISKLATLARKQKLERSFKLPRPMIGTNDFDFSFSGLKTAVLYLLRDLKKSNPVILQNDSIKMEIAREFEDAVCDVLIKKTLSAAKKYKLKSIIIGGGVSANKELARRLNSESPVPVSFPAKNLTTDNAIMIGIAGYFGKPASLSSKKLTAQGNMVLK